MCNVVLVSQYSFIRYAVKRLIQANKGMHVIADSADPSALPKIIMGRQVDLIILDVAISKKNGLEVLSDLKPLYPEIPILVINAPSNNEYKSHVLGIGCDGYLTKPSGNYQFKLAIETLLSGKKFLGKDAVADFAKSLECEEHLKELSNRELQVFIKLGNGKSLIDIASEMELSPSTISVHRMNILRKMDMNTNVDIIRFAVNHSLSNQGHHY